ncbi:thioesterase II family protein [Paraliomyxa miuraensis]|uniref:thioesterase II family protein n=1 Tax=Paraliomyxa miuraensis TaxID=376150 RepID=UPI002253EF98|nr:alpha/beta fold hydrolase [Paraliomyxa miuraensis]MCX4247323.1 thioesterase domain-containing protein [Paraliomyxa miuraensis]
MKNPWIAGRRCASEFVLSRLLCCPHAGGGSSLYAQWRGAFGPTLEVCPVLLPGREARIHEPCYRRIEALIGALCAALHGDLDRPYALFGHSLGSVVAFELARRAGAMGRPPALLMVSGRRAPHLRSRKAPTHGLDDAGLLRAVEQLNGTPAELLADPELMRVFLPCLRADFELNATYVPLTDQLLDCPVVAFMGEQDPEVEEAELVAWREVTTGPFSHHVLPGDHFYLMPPPASLLALVREELSARLPGVLA